MTGKNPVQLCIIAAMDIHGLIGQNNQLPWHLPEDLRHFKALTMGCPMIMGHRTFQSLPGLLPGRPHLVLSRHQLILQAPAYSHPNLEQALSHAAQFGDRAFVIGGAQIYALALSRADRLYLTRIEQAYCGDTWFPKWPEEDFACIESMSSNSTTGIHFRFETWQRLKHDF